MTRLVEVLAIRHAPVAVEGVCYGRTDVPTVLTAGEAAAAVESAVAAFAPGVIWSSDAERCRAPAALLSKRLGAPHRLDARLRELSCGEWEGLRWDEVPPAALEGWMEDWRRRSPPGGESGFEFAARVAGWWGGLEPGRHFLMAHAGVVQCLDVVAEGRSWEDALRRRTGFLQARRFRRDRRAPR